AVAIRAARGPGGRPGPVGDVGAADRRVGAAAWYQLHQLLQAAIVRSPLGEAATPGSAHGPEAGRPARSPPPPSSDGPAGAAAAGHRLQAAGVPPLRPRPPRRGPRTA